MDLMNVINSRADFDYGWETDQFAGIFLVFQEERTSMD